MSAQAAQRVYLDPATGKSRDPTAAELDADARETQKARADHVAAQSTLALREGDSTVLPNGMTEVYMGNRGRHELTMCRQSDGRFAECSAEQAASLGGKLGGKVGDQSAPEPAQ